MSEFYRWQEYKALSDSEFYIAKESWDYQQSKIDILEVQLRGAEERAKLALDHKNKMVDELQKKYDAMYKAFIVADDCRKDWHESYMSARKERDELVYRIDGAMKILLAMKHNGAYKAVDILKGNKDE